MSLDPNVEQMRPIWKLETGLLDFEEFSDQSHTAENLLNFYEGSLEKNGLDTTNVNMCVPDGASVCRKMMNLVFEKDPGHDSTIFNAHDLARASLDGLGVLSFLKSDGNTVLYCELRKQNGIQSKKSFPVLHFGCLFVDLKLITRAGVALMVHYTMPQQIRRTFGMHIREARIFHYIQMHFYCEYR